MVLDYLRDIAVPIVVALLGAGVWGARKVSRRTEGPPEAMPLPSPPPPGAKPQTEVEAWLFEQMKLMIPEHAEMKECLEMFRKEVRPIAAWIDTGAPPPPPTLSERLRQALRHEPESP